MDRREEGSGEVMVMSLPDRGEEGRGLGAVMMMSLPDRGEEGRGFGEVMGDVTS